MASIFPLNETTTTGRRSAKKYKTSENKEQQATNWELVGASELNANASSETE